MGDEQLKKPTTTILSKSQKPKLVKKYIPTYTEAMFPEDLERIPTHDVTKYFFHLAKVTSPYPYDSGLFKMFMDEQQVLSDATEVDGNYVVYVGDGPETFETMFIAHMDTADFDKPQEVHMIYNKGVMRTDNTTVLGADNKGGAAILLYMIDQGVPGTYWFVKGEERGRIGSSELSKQGWGIGYKRAIQFDRYGTDSIITYQSGKRSCSDEFADALALEFGVVDKGLELEKDTGGSFTDTYSFFDSIPECTNIAAGYYDQHTSYEHQDMTFLIRIAEAAAQVRWSDLPTVQDPESRASKWSYPTTNYGKGWGKSSYDDEWSYDRFDGMYQSEELLQNAVDGSVYWADVYEFVNKYPMDAAELLLEFLTGEHESITPKDSRVKNKSKKAKKGTK